VLVTPKFSKYSVLIIIRKQRNVITVSCKTVPMFGTFLVYTIFCLSAWESRSALAGARDIQALSYKYLFGSCDLAQRV